MQQRFFEGETKNNYIKKQKEREGKKDILDCIQIRIKILKFNQSNTRFEAELTFCFEFVEPIIFWFLI